MLNSRHRRRLIYLSLLLLILLGIGGICFIKTNRYLEIYRQLSSERVGTYENLQPEAQFEAQYVGSVNCESCHQEIFDKQEASMHTRMIQDVKLDPSVVVGNFATLPEDADFELANVVYTIGGKFKQRYMLLKERDGVENYRIGNYQWNTEYGSWQSYKVYNDWYHDAWPEDNHLLPTSHTCDGCHFYRLHEYTNKG